MSRRPRMFEIVSLVRDLPEHGLRRGLEGTVLELYEPNGVEVEFLDEQGEHVAVLTLLDGDVRCTDDNGPQTASRTHDGG